MQEDTEEGDPWDMLCMSDRRGAQADEGEGSRLRIMTGRQLEGGEVGPICSSPQTLDLDCLITFRRYWQEQSIQNGAH